MPLSFAGSAAGGGKGESYADAAAAIPEALLVSNNFAQAGAALEFLARAAGDAGDGGGSGVIPVSAADPTPDPFASLWFIRASHLFAAAGGEPALATKLLTLSKRILQDFIAGRGLSGVKMDDGGLLLTPPPSTPPGPLSEQALRLNALWYSALESTAKDLERAGDKSGDHFERLAGRFRRAFAKSFWCDGHNCICPPYRRTADSHGDIPDAEQLLLTILPASPIPRTKQRQLLQLVRAKSQVGPAKSTLGLLIDHPTLGRVESPLHRAWLAVGMMNAAENRATVIADAAAIMVPLEEPAASGALAPYYKDGKPIGKAGDALTNAHVNGAIGQVKGSARNKNING